MTNFDFNKALLKIEDDGIKFEKSSLDSATLGARAYNELYGFDQCKLGDKLYYEDGVGFNIMSGEEVGECCIEAGTLDKHSRFWAIANGHYHVWTNNMNKFKSIKKYNDLYSYHEWKKDINGYEISNNSEMMNDCWPEKECKEFGECYYLPSAAEMMAAYENQMKGFTSSDENYKIYTSISDYWTSTLASDYQVYALTINDTIEAIDFDNSCFYKPFIHVVNNQKINEDLSLLSFNDADDITFKKSDTSAKAAANAILPVRLKSMPKDLFIKSVYKNLYKDKSMSGFSFNNTIFNENPVLVKYLNDASILHGSSLYINLMLNKWTPILSGSESIILSSYLNYIYDYGYTDRDIIDKVMTSKYSFITSINDIKQAKTNPNYEMACKILDQIYYDYFYNITKLGEGIYNIYVNGLYLSKDKDLFMASFTNLRMGEQADIKIFENHVGKSFIIIGYTGFAEPAGNDNLVIDKKKEKAFKNQLEDLFTYKNEDGSVNGDKFKLPKEFHPEMVNNNIAYVTLIDPKYKYIQYYDYRWYDIFKGIEIKNKVLNDFVKYKLDYGTWYVDNKDLRDQFIDENENKPLIIKAPYNGEYLCLLYLVYMQDRRHLKIVILDNSEYQVIDKHSLIMCAKTDTQWCGW